MTVVTVRGVDPTRGGGDAWRVGAGAGTDGMGRRRRVADRVPALLLAVVAFGATLLPARADDPPLPDAADFAREHLELMRRRDPPRASGAPLPRLPPDSEVDRELDRLEDLISTCTTGSRGSLRVVYQFRSSGDLLRARVRATGLDASDRTCVEQLHHLTRSRSVWLYPSFPRRPPAPFRSGIAECDDYAARACACPDLPMREASCESAPRLVRAWRARADEAAVRASCGQMLGVLRRTCGP